MPKSHKSGAGRRSTNPSARSHKTKSIDERSDYKEHVVSASSPGPTVEISVRAIADNSNYADHSGSSIASGTNRNRRLLPPQDQENAEDSVSRKSFNSFKTWLITGGALTILGLVAGIAITYGEFTTKLNVAQSEIDKLRAGHDGTTGDLGGLAQRITRLEAHVSATARVGEPSEKILAVIENIRDEIRTERSRREALVDALSARIDGIVTQLADKANRSDE